MIKTVFVDVTKGEYKDKGEYNLNIPCNVVEFVDFTNFNPLNDEDLYEVVNIIHLPNEAKKIIEIKLARDGGSKRNKNKNFDDDDDDD